MKSNFRKYGLLCGLFPYTYLILVLTTPVLAQSNTYATSMLETMPTELANITVAPTNAITNVATTTVSTTTVSTTVMNMREISSNASQTVTPSTITMTSQTNQNESMLVAIIAATSVVIVVIVLVTSICLCCITSRKKGNEKRRHIHNNSIPHNHDNSKVNQDIYEEDDAKRDRSNNQTNSHGHTFITKDEGFEGKPQANTSRSSSLSVKSTEKDSLGKQARSRSPASNIFNQVDPTVEIYENDVELSPIVSESSGRDHVFQEDTRDTQSQPKAVSKNILQDRPKPQPRVRSMNVQPDVIQSHSFRVQNETEVKDPEASEDLIQPTSPSYRASNPEGPRKFRIPMKGKGPDGSDQAALLANVIRKSKSDSHSPENNSADNTTYW